MIVDCYVCGEDLDTGEAHTFHDEECPRRDVIHQDFDVLCDKRPGCGEDVHEACCPTCSEVEA